ncbi:DMT family transporter [Campylobacter corcagiensis]|uniref:Guanidinium exporter n=1 Tax=Campylobacter corcagiensis TaxID=1448857 RepID=A0A7M1LIY6_9BACT|nr:multidrug efflux SMR transporter [Campylobacter corcagiensis]QKF63991.1 multidrug efflux system protein, EmrE family [Campylobacter corcagiensis]QOQ87806.1 multidrug efflux SMR transporter [Campylobacter corcagiensis]
MSWIYLIIAGILEAVGIYGTKKYTITKRKRWIVFMGLNFAVSLFFLRLSMREISMGTAYAIWTGIGTVGGMIVGIALFGESLGRLKILFAFIIISSAVGLKFIG